MMAFLILAPGKKKINILAFRNIEGSRTQIGGRKLVPFKRNLRHLNELPPKLGDFLPSREEKKGTPEFCPPKNAIPVPEALVNIPRITIFEPSTLDWLVLNPQPIAHLLIIYLGKWPSFAHLLITKHSPVDVFQYFSINHSHHTWRPSSH